MRRNSNTGSVTLSRIDPGLPAWLRRWQAQDLSLRFFDIGGPFLRLQRLHSNFEAVVTDLADILQRERKVTRAV